MSNSGVGFQRYRSETQAGSTGLRRPTSGVCMCAATTTAIVYSTPKQKASNYKVKIFPLPADFGGLSAKVCRKT